MCEGRDTPLERGLNLLSTFEGAAPTLGLFRSETVPQQIRDLIPKCGDEHRFALGTASHCQAKRRPYQPIAFDPGVSLLPTTVDLFLSDVGH